MNEKWENIRDKMMNNVSELLLYLLAEIINYTLTYMILFNVHITKKIYKILMGCGIIITFHLLIYYMGPRELTYDLTIITMLVIPWLLLDERRKEFFILYLFIYGLGSIVGVGTAFVRSLLLTKPIDEILEPGKENLICLLYQTVVMAVIFLCVRLWKNRSNGFRFSLSHYIIFNVVAFVSCLGIGSIEELCVKGIYDKELTVSGLAITFADIIMMVSVILIGIIQQRRLEAENRIYYSEQMALMQKNHYERMMVKDEQLKKFRHDLRGHLTVMKSYLVGGDNKKTLKYLNAIEEITELSGRMILTGNGVIDAIIESFEQECKDNCIKINVDGIYGPNEQELDMEIGVIAYNLIKNAVEACEEIEDKAKRYISIKVSTFNDKKFLKIVNSSSGKYRKQGEVLMTTKKDDFHHGYGMLNVQDAIMKCGGEIEYSITDEVFEVVVVI